MPITDRARARRLGSVLAATFLGCLCLLLAPAAAGARHRARPQATPGEEAPAPAPGEGQGGEEAGEQQEEPAAGEAPSSPRRERRARRQDERAGCTVELQGPRALVASGAPQLSGTLSCEGGAGEQTVVLFQKLLGTPGFFEAASTQTEADGSFSFSPAPLAGDSAFYARAAGARSARVRVSLLTQVTLQTPAAGATLPAAGAGGAAGAGSSPSGAVTFAGTVTPAAAGAGVALEREFGHERWQRIALGRVGEEGRFALVHSFARTGSVRLRVLVHAYGGYGRTASAPVAYTIASRRRRALTTGAPASAPTFTLLPAPAPAEAQAGATVYFGGTLTPAVEGQTVELEREALSRLHGFHVIATGTVGPGSTYTIPCTFATPGQALLRVSVPAAGELAATAGEAFTLAVTPAP